MFYSDCYFLFVLQAKQQIRVDNDEDRLVSQVALHYTRLMVLNLTNNINKFKYAANKCYLIHYQKDVHISHIKNPMTDSTQLLQQRKRCCSKMPYMISSRSVTDGVNKSKSGLQQFDIC